MNVKWIDQRETHAACANLGLSLAAEKQAAHQPSAKHLLRTALQTTAFVLIGLAASGCATVQRVPLAASTTQTSTEAAPSQWSGRLSLQVEDRPEQSFYASFELQGRAEEGGLTLISPLGSVLATVIWNSQQAVLTTSSGQRQATQIDALLQDLTGTPIPVAALFDWLHGKNSTVAGWQADTSGLALGRLVAVRELPQPTTTLRLVLNR